MNRHFTTLSLIHVLTGCLCLSGQIENVGKISGKIMSSATKAPISGCEVKPLQMGSSSSVPPARSDDEGAFTLLDIPKGTYFLAVSCKGFASKWVWSLTPQSSRSGFSIDERKREYSGAVIEMDPHSSITGWVSLPPGFKSSKLQIQAFSQAFVAGQPVYIPKASAQTGFDGGYKLEGLSAGTYFLHISKPDNHPNQLASPSSASSGSGAILEPGFYPGTHDIAAATPISLSPGTSLSAVEIKVRMVAGYSVSGRLADVGQIAKGRLPFHLRQVSANGTLGPILNTTVVTPPHLHFEFKDVPSGDFQLELADHSHPGGLLWSHRISVSKQDLTDLELEIAPLVTAISTSLRCGDRPDRKALELELSRAYISFQNLDNPTMTPVSAYLRPNANPRQLSLHRGRNLISFHQLPEWAYLIDAKAAGVSFARAISRTGYSPTASNLDLEFAIGAGQMIAEVTAAGGARLADAVVLIVAEDEVQPYRFVKTSQSGRAIISNLAPGKYRVKAWANSSAEAANSPQSIADAIATGVTVDVGERSSTTVQVRAAF